MGTFSHQWFSSINEIDQAQWQRLFGDEPFTQHAFLYALEQSQCVTQQSGWQPHHLAIFEGDTLIALAPGYLKSHSYGEYVFDWAWAEAYEKHGLEYYPKWLSGIPFSPIEGKRIAIEHANPNALCTNTLQSNLTYTVLSKGGRGGMLTFATKPKLHH